MYSDILKELENKAKKSISFLKDELSKVRAGRANPVLVDGILVEAYGAMTPLNQIASITVPEARLLVIQPWDHNLIKEIEKAILRSDLGITPSSDGKVIRLPFPPLTEERRKELAKSIWKTAENNKVTVRNARREAMDEIKKREKDGDLREDESKRAQDDVQEIVDKYTDQIDEITQEKENELMEI